VMTIIPGKTFETPTPQVRKQTRDVVALLKHVVGKSRYYLFMEDDFAFCPHFVTLLHYLINKAHVYYPNWISIKVSFGLNGFILKNYNSDLDTYANYMLKHQRRRPPDHLQTEWAAGETAESGTYKAGRPHLAFRYNLLYHMGRVSSLRDQPSGEFSQCFAELTAPVLFEIDAFKPLECGHDDIWPCHARNSEKFRQNPRFPLDITVNPKPTNLPF